MAKVLKRTKTRAARGTGTIFQDKRRGGWVARVPVGKYPSGGTRYREVRGDSQAEVIERAKALKPPHAGTTVKDWSARWLTASGVRDSTRSDYTHTIDKLVAPAIGHMKLSEVTAADVQAMVAGWDIGANTARKNLGQVRVMFGAAVRARLITHNPAKEARKPKAKKVLIRPFAVPDLARIVTAARTDEGCAMFALMASVGCRIGEALALDVPDYDPTAGTVSITSTYSRAHGLRRAKSENSVRTVRVPAMAVPALTLAIGKRTTGPLFASPLTRGRISEKHAGRRWKRLLEQLAIPHRNPHQLRHSVATHAIADGVPLANVARDLGDTIETVVKTYLHPVPGRDVCGAMEGLLGGRKVGEPSDNAVDRLKKRG